jgi:hypothetical protein
MSANVVSFVIQICSPTAGALQAAINRNADSFGIRIFNRYVRLKPVAVNLSAGSSETQISDHFAWQRQSHDEHSVNSYESDTAPHQECSSPALP